MVIETEALQILQPPSVRSGWDKACGPCVMLLSCDFQRKVSAIPAINKPNEEDKKKKTASKVKKCEWSGRISPFITHSLPTAHFVLLLECCHKI